MSMYLALIKDPIDEFGRNSWVLFHNDDDMRKYSKYCRMIQPVSSVPKGVNFVHHNPPLLTLSEDIDEEEFEEFKERFDKIDLNEIIKSGKDVKPIPPQKDPPRMATVEDPAQKYKLCENKCGIEEQHYDHEHYEENYEGEMTRMGLPIIDKDVVAPSSNDDLEIFDEPVSNDKKLDRETE